MNNQTKSIPSSDIMLSLGHLASILSLLFILIIILITLFIFFTRQNYISSYDEQEISTNENERRSFQYQQSKRYSSTMNSETLPSINSFQMNIDEHNARSTTNLLMSK